MDKNKLRLALAEKVKTISTQAGRSAFAELLIETIEPNHLSLDIFSLFLPTRQMNPGDTLVRKVRKGRYPAR